MASYSRYILPRESSEILLTKHKCAPVRFIEEANSTAGPTCKNGTNFKAVWGGATATTKGATSNASSALGTASSTPAGASTALQAGVGSVLAVSLFAAALAL